MASAENVRLLMATTRLISSAPADRERHGITQPLRQLLEDGKRDCEGGTLIGVKITETPRQRVIPFRADPLEQTAPSVGRNDPADAPIDFVVHPADEAGLLEPRDEAGEHRRI